MGHALAAYLFRPVDRPLRILILGLGAGTVVKKIQHYACISKLIAIAIAIAIDATHIYIAKTLMGLNSADFSFYHADAVEWLASYQGQCFDVIIDDLYFEQECEPLRAVDFQENNRSWLPLLKSRLYEGGLLIANCVSPAQARTSVSTSSPGFKHGMRFTKSEYAHISGSV